MLPNSLGWVIAVLIMGGLISIVAAYGYKSISKFANIAAPWMELVFLVFGLVGIKQFIDATGITIRSTGDLWGLAQSHIWKGGQPLEGQIKFSLWHIAFFAWFCNMGMHIGMSDLSVFRFARKSWYSISTAAGMYVGHFMAWLCASVLYAYQLYLDPTDTDVLPGLLAFRATGLVGLLCVIISGWSTANPMIYRSGLAFQAIVPKTSRFVATLITGAIATVAGLFPAIAMKLLSFVALYGLLLMPMGAVIFVVFLLIRRFGLQNNYALRSQSTFNWAAGLTWFLTLAICTCLVWFSGVQIFFVSLPGWFIAAILYILISKIYQQNIRPSKEI